jgi:hypothetical protein
MLYDSYMNTLKIIAMPTTHALAVRTTLADEFGSRPTWLIDDGSGPCRHCLRVAQQGDPLLLFTYRPFAKPGPYQESGPVFLHANGCERFAEGAGFPPDFAQRPLVLRPYDARDHIHVAQALADAGEAENAARALLADPDVAYVHARSRSHGCFMFRIERA